MSKPPVAPNHLGVAGRRLWTYLQAAYAIADPPGLALLLSACESRDRIEQAREELERDGISQTDRFGMLRAHPAAQIEHQARSSLIRALTALNLSPEGTAI